MDNWQKWFIMLAKDNETYEQKSSSFEIFGNKIRYDKLIMMEESSSNCSSLKILFAIWLDCETYGVDTE